MQLISRHKLGDKATGIWVAQSWLIQYIPDYSDRTLTLKSASYLSIPCEGLGAHCHKLLQLVPDAFQSRRKEIG